MRNPLLVPESTAENRAEFRRLVMEYRRTHSINETIARFRVSRTFVCKWQKRFRVGSSDLWERSREPKVCADRYTGEEKARLKSSLLIDNQESRKRNKLIPTIFRFCQMLANRSNASIRRIANNLIGRYKRAKNSKPKKKVRTGRRNQVVDFPGGLVQVDMKCVPASSVVQRPKSDQLRKDALVQSARQHMEGMMNKLVEQECLFPGLFMIGYLKDECQHEYQQNVDDIQNAILEPEKS